MEPTYKPLSTSHLPPSVNPFTRSEDESVSRVLCVRVLAPMEGLGGAALVGGVLQKSYSYFFKITSLFYKKSIHPVCVQNLCSNL
jgi:hypothetical protein